MANRQFGYGVANTFGIRDFSGKVEGVGNNRPSMHMRQNGYMILLNRGFRAIFFFLFGV
jgi:hypothetical protein